MRKPVIEFAQPRRVGINALREISDRPIEFLQLNCKRGRIVAPQFGFGNDAGKIAELFLRG